ncbi:hypothetical protein ACQP1W_43675 [Spirillospora sp. CA-255316]
MSSLLNQGRGTGRKGLAKAREPDPADLAARKSGSVEPAPARPAAGGPVPPEQPDQPGQPVAQPEQAAGTHASADQAAEAPVGGAAAGEIAALLGDNNYAEVAKRLPEVPAQEATGKTKESLTAQDRAEYRRAMRILAEVEAGFWVQGRVWEFLRNSRVYTVGYDNWETFCQMELRRTSRRINQTIEVWPLAQHLLLTVGARHPEVVISEAHVRGLRTFAKEQGADAAAFVLEALIRCRVALSKRRIEAAVAALPHGQFDPETAAPALRVFADGVAKAIEVAADNGDQGADPVEAVVRRFRDRVGEVAKKNPATARRLIEELSELVAELRKQLGE